MFPYTVCILNPSTDDCLVVVRYLEKEVNYGLTSGVAEGIHEALRAYNKLFHGEEYLGSVDWKAGGKDTKDMKFEQISPYSVVDIYVRKGVSAD